MFPAESSTFDFPLYLSLAGVVGGRGIEGVIWDKVNSGLDSGSKIYNAHSQDLMRKEYMGEVAIPSLDWFNGADVKLWSEDLPASPYLPVSLPRSPQLVDRRLVSTRRKHSVSGTVSFRIGFLPPKDTANSEDALKKLRRIYSVFAENAGVGKGLVGVLGVPAVRQRSYTPRQRPAIKHRLLPVRTRTRKPASIKLTVQTEGIGTVKLRRDSDVPATRKKSRSPFAMLRSSAHVAASPIAAGHKTVPLSGEPDERDDDSDDSDDIADDGLSSSSDEEYEDAQDETGFRDSPSDIEALNDQMYNTTVAVPGPKPSDAPKTAGLAVPPKTRTPSRQSSLPTRAEGYFDMPSHKSSGDSATLSDTPGYTPAVTPGGKRKIFKRSKSKQPKTKSSKKDFNFNADSGKEVLGIVIMEIKGAEDLPKLKSCESAACDQYQAHCTALRVTFDMDPFVVVSFGKKVFRTRVIRHSLNPTWDEKLLFHVRKHEKTYTTQFTVLDWDKVGEKIHQEAKMLTCRSPATTWLATARCRSAS